MTSILAFDIETVPNVHDIHLLYDLPNNLPDSETVTLAQQECHAQTDGDFMQHHLYQVVAISCYVRWGQDKIHVGTIDEIYDNEEAIIARFLDLIETHTPQLVSWSDDDLDLPALHYCSLIYDIATACYWDAREGDLSDSRDFKWNSCTNRYHNRHYDLMDLLALRQPYVNVPLDNVTKLRGSPDGLGMDDGRVWKAPHAGRPKDICDHCETDAADTYLIYLRFRLMGGALSADEYEAEIKCLKNYLADQARDKLCWAEFTRA